MLATIEVFGSAIVITGTFNPAIFTPDWLERNNLIGKDDADAARQSENSVITTKISQFETEWFLLQVVGGQFALSSKGAVSPSIKDLAVGIFTLLSHTPVSAVGLNFMAHYKFTKIDDYFKIGDILAPKAIWHKLFDSATTSAGLEDLTILIEPYKRGTVPATQDAKRVVIQPSRQVKHGVYFAFNDHHDVANDKSDNVTKAELVTKVIAEYWDASWHESTHVFESVISQALETEPLSQRA